MLDIHFIRDNPDIVRAAITNKKAKVSLDELLEADATRRKLKSEFDEASQDRKAHAKRSDAPTQEDIQTGKALKARLRAITEKLDELNATYDQLISAIPNIPSDDTPVGGDETGNMELRRVGDVPTFAFTPKEHWEIGGTAHLIDSERAAKVSGSRFTYLKGELAWLELALVQFAVTQVSDARVITQVIKDNKLAISEKPFVPVIPPALIHHDTLRKMARLEPRDERYFIPTDDLYLIGSAEHTLGALHMGELLAQDTLPLRYVGVAPAFRREAGSYGKDMRGILRLHQFNKVEMESFSTPEMGRHEQDLMIGLQEYMWQKLQLPYRVMQICTGDMGAPDARQIDIETWLPGQDRYRETHTADYMTDYQARRLGTRVRIKNKGNILVHTNDATALAVGRTIAAILENNQQEDGSVIMPKALHGYLPFTTIPAVSDT